MTQDQIMSIVKSALDNNQRYFEVGPTRYEIVQNGKTGWHIRTMLKGEKREGA